MSDEWTLVKIVNAAWDTTSKLLQVQTRGDGDEGDDASAEQADDVPVFQPFGLAVRPVVAATLRGLALRMGVEPWILKLWDRSRLPTDIAEGETRLYSIDDLATVVRLLASGKDGGTDGVVIKSGTTTITVKKSGKIEIESGSNDVVFNGGTEKVARVNDTVHSGFLTITHVPSAGVGVTPCSLTIVHSNTTGGTVGTVVDSGVVTLNTGKITAGAEHVKA
jgi:hypothetical protein